MTEAPRAPTSPAFSVVVPLFNKEPYVARALTSVLGQTWQVFEIIVVDDGSTDDGASVVARLADPRIRLVRQTNAGPGAARNRGAALASNPYLAFLDADDEWGSEYLARVTEAIGAFPDRRIGIYTALSRRLGPHAVEYRVRPAGSYHVIDSFCREARRGYPVNSSTAVIPRSVFEEVGGFQEHQRLREDVDLWIRISLRYPIVSIPEFLTTIHDDDPERATGRFQCRPPLIEVDSICRFFDCGIDEIPSADERRFCRDALYRYCLGMLRHGRLGAFDASYPRSRHTFRRRLVLRSARSLHFLIPKRS